MTEATYTHYNTADPAIEVFDVTTAPTDGLTLTCQRLQNPIVVGIAKAAVPTTSLDWVYEKSRSGSVITLGVYGTGYKCRVVCMEANI